MATTQSSSPLRPTQWRAKPAPAPTISLVEQQLWLSVESPQLLAAIEILLPLAKTHHRLLAAPRSSSWDPSVAEMMKSEAEAWAVGIALAEDALEPIKPYGHVLVLYLHRLEAVINAKKAVQP